MGTHFYGCLIDDETGELVRRSGAREPAPRELWAQYDLMAFKKDGKLWLKPVRRRRKRERKHP